MKQEQQSLVVHQLLEPALSQANFELVDVVLTGGTLQVLVELAGTHPRALELGGRIDLDGVSEATKIVDETLEGADPIADPYTLEVSSPGLERPLRTPAHFQRFVRATVAVKTLPGVVGDRRIEGILESADADADGSIVVNGRSIAYADIDRARTVFVWGGQPKGSPVKKKHPKQPNNTTKYAVEESPNEA
jgi:ribosome maturation factor RimP